MAVVVVNCIYRPELGMSRPEPCVIQKIKRKLIITLYFTISPCIMCLVSFCNQTNAHFAAKDLDEA